MQIQREYFRKPINYRLAVFSEFVRPPLRFFATLKTSSTTPSKMWRKGLLIGSDHIGDILYRTPSFPSLAKAFPDCRWHMVASPPADQLLRNNPYVSCVICQPSNRFSSFLALIRSFRFDVIICYGSPTLWKDLILSVMAGIPNRIAYSFKGFSGLITHPMKINYPQPYPAYFCDMVAQIAAIKPDWNLRPLIYPDRSDESDAEDLWSQHHMRGCGPIVACFMTTRQPTGLWPSEKFGRTLALIQKQIGAHIVLCGSSGDRTLLEQVDKTFNLKASILPGTLTLRALFCFLKKTDAVLTSDSGPRHVANAAGIPVFFLRNILSNRIETGAYVDTETDLSPPDEYVPQNNQAAVFAKILPEEVAAQIVKSIMKAK